MTVEQLALDMAAKAEELGRCLDREKLSSSSITRHNVTMAKKELALSVAKFRMRPITQEQKPMPVVKRKFGYLSPNQKWLGQ